MRKFVLIAAMVLASASAQAGESRSLSAYPVRDDVTATVSNQPAANTTLRAENVTNTTTTAAPPPAETPRYSAPPAPPAPPADAARNVTEQPPAETPHYTARPAPTSAATTATTTTQQPSETASEPVRSRRARAERPHGHGRWTAGRIIATLHRYGVYW